MNRWRESLDAGERIVWQGRPAPRAFTFRNWRWSLLGGAGLMALLLWPGGVAELQAEGDSLRWWLMTCLLAGGWTAVGHVVWARLEWERVFYLLTDRRLLAVSGILGRRRRQMSLAELRKVESAFLGAELASITVTGRGRRLVLHCLEHPQLLLGPLFSLTGKTPGTDAWLGDTAQGV